MDDGMLDSYFAYVQSQCGFWSPGNDCYLSGEILSHWHNRKSFQREMNGLQAEVSRIDGVLSGLLYEQKKRLCRLGKNGGWSRWLKQHKIPRATADRLVLEHIEFFGLRDELPKRERFELPSWKISRAAQEVGERHENMLKAPDSKIKFLWCLADRLGVAVDYGVDGSIRLSTPPPDKPEDIDCRVPNVAQIDADGKLVPVDYELKDEQESDDGLTSASPQILGDVL